MLLYQIELFDLFNTCCSVKVIQAFAFRQNRKAKISIICSRFIENVKFIFLKFICKSFMATGSDESSSDSSKYEGPVYTLSKPIEKGLYSPMTN